VQQSADRKPFRSRLPSVVVEERCSCGKPWSSFDKLKLSRDVCAALFARVVEGAPHQSK
jgi:hypothetical protein